MLNEIVVTEFQKYLRDDFTLKILNYFVTATKIALYGDVELMSEALENTFSKGNIVFKNASKVDDAKNIFGHHVVNFKIDKDTKQKDIFLEINNNIKNESVEKRKEYYEIVFMGLDINAYVALFKCQNKKSRVVQAYLNKFGININNKDVRKKIDAVRIVRNSFSHTSLESVKELTDPEEAIKQLEDFYNVFGVFKTKNEKEQKLLDAVCSPKKAKELYDRGLEIINSKPLPLNEVVAKCPGASEDVVKELYKKTYDEDNKLLYCYSMETIKSKCLKLFNGYLKLNSSGDNLVRKDGKKDKVFFSALYKYEKRLRDESVVNPTMRESELDEIIKNADILVETSALMNKGCRKFIRTNIMPKLQKYKKQLYVDYSTRVELTLIENNKDGKYTDKKVEDAKKAHNELRTWKDLKFVKYLRKPDIIYREGYRALIDIANEYPDNKFVILAKNTNIADEINEETENNCLVVNFYDISKLYVTEDSLPRLYDFCFEARDDEEIVEDTVGDNDDGDNNMEDAESVEESEKVEEVEESTIVEEEKPVEEEKVKDTRKKSEEYRLPKIGSLDVIPENKEMLDCTIMPEIGDFVYYEGGEKVQLLKKVGAGGEGFVYSVGDGIVAKIYKKHCLTRNRFEKLQMMVQLDNKIEELCWPIDLLYNKRNEFVGFTMKEVPSTYLGLGASVLNVGNPVFMSKMPSMSKWTRKTLAAFCKELSATFVKLHEANILMGDINQNNILVNPSNYKDYAIVDCDSFQVGPYPCPVGFPNFTCPEIFTRLNTDAPEYGKFLRTKSDEEYSLASMLFRILMLGADPFMGKDTEDNYLDNLKQYNFAYRTGESSGKDTPDGAYRLIWNNTPKGIKDRFAKVFTGDGVVSARAWVKAFDGYVSDIEKKEYTDEITPIKYWDTKDRKYTVDFKCQICNVETNMPKETYELLTKRNQLLLCNRCRTLMMENQKISAKCKCTKCGKTFIGNKWDYMLQANGMPSDAVCPMCEAKMNEKIDVKCSGCGRTVKVVRHVYENNYNTYGSYKCNSCLEQVETRCSKCGAPTTVARFKTYNSEGVVCQSCLEKVRVNCDNCGAITMVPRFWTQSGGRLLCENCRRKRR